MASIFWDSHGVIMIDYLEQDRTINSAYYADKLRQLSQEITRGEENLLAVFCSCRTNPLPTRHKLP